MVETSFEAAQKITMLNGVVAQDVIQVELNPSEGDNVFARVEAVLTTQVQYPYAIRSPDEDTSPMTVVVGDTVEGTGTHASSVIFIEFDHEGSCMEDPQDYCPELMDEVRVVGDFRVYKNEEFTALIDNESDPYADITDHDKVVYTNDQLYYEATYRTASASVIASESLDFKDNDDAGYGNADIIDYVRPTKIFMDVTLGQTRDGGATGTDKFGSWNAANWDLNMNFAPLGSTRIP